MVLRVSLSLFFSPLFVLCQLQGSVTEYEFSQEEFRNLQQEFWCKFYACCLQYQEALSHPLALHLNPHTNMVCLLKKVRKLKHIELLQKVPWIFQTISLSNVVVSFQNFVFFFFQNYGSFVFRQSSALFIIFLHFTLFTLLYTKGISNFKELREQHKELLYTLHPDSFVNFHLLSFLLCIYIFVLNPVESQSQTLYPLFLKIYYVS